MSAEEGSSGVCEAPSREDSDSGGSGDKGTPSTTMPESEDANESPRGLLSPPGLRGQRPWDAWDEEGVQTKLDDGVFEDAAAPPGLDGGYEAAAVPAWMTPYATLQVTTKPVDDWKALFRSEQDAWKCQEPAIVQTSETSTAEGSNSVSDDSPAYVKSPTFEHVKSPVLQPSKLASENEILAAENARLVMENEILKNSYMDAPWASGATSENLSPYWTPEKSPELSWMGMPPFVPTPWMMPMSQMAMWSEYAGAEHRSSNKQHRARTDSIVGLHHRKSNGSGDTGRSRAYTDINDCHGLEEYEVALTTVMLRNLPNNYSRTMLIKLIDSEGFSGQYDFIYLPMDFKSHASLGYAFVNLVTAEQATRFFETFEGFHRWVVPSQKVCSVNWSHPYQGIDAHIERYRNSPVMHEDVPDEYKPMVFENGERIAFPPPTKKLKVPRMRPGHEKTILEDGTVVE